MSGLFSGCRTCMPILLSIIGMIGFFYLFYFLVKKHPRVFWTIIITSIVVSFLTLVSNRFIFPRLLRLFPSRQAQEEWIIYDSDPRNDEYIKGGLPYRKLLQLDRILLKEKELCGERLNSQELNEIARYDIDLVEAYDRWRKAKNMRRSHHRTIYPDERRLYYYLRR